MSLGRLVLDFVDVAGATDDLPEEDDYDQDEQELELSRHVHDERRPGRT